MNVARAFKRRLHPTFDRILVERRTRKPRTVGGLMLPERVGNRSLNEGVVVAIGKGRRTADGKFLPMSLKVGDAVLLPENVGTSIKFNNKDCVILREDEILGLIEDTDEPQNVTVELPNVKDLPNN